LLDQRPPLRHRGDMVETGSVDTEIASK
jgi:hypothetical protein